MWKSGAASGDNKRYMANEISNPLLDIIRKAAAKPVTDGPMAKRAQRFDHATATVVVAIDGSGSMVDHIGSTGMSKWDQARIALRDVCLGNPEIILISFSSGARIVPNASQLPADLMQAAVQGYGGGTDLTAALKLAKGLRPRKTIIISDGMPDNQQTALEVAEQITGAVDTIYCGPDSHPAIAFLRQLAHDNAGEPLVWDGLREMAPCIRGLLT